MSIPTWYKRDFSFINNENMLQLLEVHSFKGFYVYERFISTLGQEGTFKIPLNSTKLNFLLRNISAYSGLDVDQIQKIVDFFIEKKIMIIENNEIVVLEIKTCFEDMEKTKEKKRSAGQKGGKATVEKRLSMKLENKNNSDIPKIESKDKNEKASWNNNTFNKDDIDGYSDSFDVGIQLHPRDEIDSNYPKLEYKCLNKFPREYLEKAVQDFISLTTERFNKLTEPYALKNRLERQACEGFMKLIRQGVPHIPALGDNPDSEEPKYDFLNDIRKSCDKVLNTCENPAFYMTNLYNNEIRQIMEMKMTKPDCFIRIFGELDKDLDLKYIE